MFRVGLIRRIRLTRSDLNPGLNPSVIKRGTRHRPLIHISTAADVLRAVASGDETTHLSQRRATFENSINCQKSESVDALPAAVRAAQEAAFDPTASSTGIQAELHQRQRSTEDTKEFLVAESEAEAEFGTKHKTVGNTIKRIGAAALALRAVGVAERMPAEALELIDSIASNSASLLALDAPIMFKTSAADSFTLLSAVNDVIEAVHAWELHKHEGPLEELERHVGFPKERVIGGGESLQALMHEARGRIQLSKLLSSAVSCDDGAKGCRSPSSDPASCPRRSEAERILEGAAFADIIARNRPATLAGCQRQQQAMMRALRFVVPRTARPHNWLATMPEVVRVDESMSSTSERSTGGDEGALLLLRFLYTLLMWGGDRVGTTHARVALAIKIVKVFNCEGTAVEVRDEAHELLSFFVRYHSSDFCSHARLHSSDVAMLMNACSAMGLWDPFTWSSLTDAAAKSQSAFHSGDKRWMMQKVGTVVPRGLRGLSETSLRELSAASSTVAPAISPTRKTATTKTTAPAAVVTNGRFSDFGGSARPFDESYYDPSGKQPHADEDKSSTGVSPITCSGFSHLSVRETFLLTSQVASVGGVLKKKRYSGDRAVYERYLFRNLIEKQGRGGRDGLRQREELGAGAFVKGVAPGGLGPSTCPSDGRHEPAESFDIETEIIADIRRKITKEALDAALILASRERCAMMTASGPRRRLFVTLVVRAQMDLNVLTEDEIADYVLRFEDLMLNRSKWAGDADDPAGSGDDDYGPPTPQSFRSLVNGPTRNFTSAEARRLFEKAQGRGDFDKSLTAATKMLLAAMRIRWTRSQ